MARVTLALAVVASLTTAAPAARAAGGCEVPSGAHVKATAKHAVAYRVGSRVFACLHGTGDRVLLERLGEHGGRVTRVGPIVLAGPHVVYAKRRTSSSSDFWGYVEVVHIDLRNPGGRDADTPWGDPGPPSAYVLQIVLAPDGAYAYTAQGFQPDEAGEKYYEERLVIAHDGAGRRALDYWGNGGSEDDSGAIDLGSLVRRHRVVSWMHAGESRSAHLRDVGSCRVPPDARVERFAAGTVVYKRYGGTLACIGRVGKAQVINEDVISDGRYESSDTYRIGGRFVGWTELVERDGHADERYVRLYDLGRRHLVREALVTSNDCRADVGVPDIAVARTGAFAWTTAVYDSEHVCTLVTAWDACGRSVLDEGVDTNSLRIAGAQVRWTASGAERSAPLRSSADC
ncbi:MAG: hypothetical protein ACJ760_09425 [Thermoleophilaceae bacterium]